MYLVIIIIINFAEDFYRSFLELRLDVKSPELELESLELELNWNLLWVVELELEVELKIAELELNWKKWNWPQPCCQLVSKGPVS